MLPFVALHFEKFLTHIRLFHASERRVDATLKATNGGPKVSTMEHLDFCESCIAGGMHHKPVIKTRENKKPRSPNNRLIHTDWWGPYNTPSTNGDRFIQVFIDDESGFVWLYCSPKKDCGAKNVTNMSKELRELIGYDVDIKISAIQSDLDVVYTEGDFAAWCDVHGVLQRFSAPYTQSQNGRAERFWRTMENHVASIFCYVGISLSFWHFAVRNYASTHNITVASAGHLTPYELITKRRPDISGLVTWGCPALAFLEKHEHKKFTPKCRPGLNLGPDPQTKDAYFIYFPDSRRIHTTRNVTFDELWRERANYYQQVAMKFPSLTLYPPPPPPILPPPPPFVPQPPPPSLDMGIFFGGQREFLRQPPRPEREQTPDNRQINADEINTPAQPTGRIIENRGEHDINFGESHEPLDGPNSNKEDSRLTAITPRNDTNDIDGIRRRAYESSNSAPRYVTAWAQCYNMTQEAIDARLKPVPNMSAFRFNLSTPSQHL